MLFVNADEPRHKWGPVTHRFSEAPKLPLDVCGHSDKLKSTNDLNRKSDRTPWRENRRMCRVILRSNSSDANSAERIMGHIDRPSCRDPREETREETTDGLVKRSAVISEELG